MKFEEQFPSLKEKECNPKSNPEKYLKEYSAYGVKTGNIKIFYEGHILENCLDKAIVEKAIEEFSDEIWNDEKLQPDCQEQDWLEKIDELIKKLLGGTQK